MDEQPVFHCSVGQISDSPDSTENGKWVAVIRGVGEFSDLPAYRSPAFKTKAEAEGALHRKLDKFLESLALPTTIHKVEKANRNVYH